MIGRNSKYFSMLYEYGAEETWKKRKPRWAVQFWFPHIGLTWLDHSICSPAVENCVYSIILMGGGGNPEPAKLLAPFAIPGHAAQWCRYCVFELACIFSRQKPYHQLLLYKLESKSHSLKYAWNSQVPVILFLGFGWTVPSSICYSTISRNLDMELGTWKRVVLLPQAPAKHYNVVCLGLCNVMSQFRLR